MLHGSGKVHLRFDELENARDTWNDYDCRCKLQSNCVQSSCHPFFTLQFFKYVDYENSKIGQLKMYSIDFNMCILYK